MSRMVRMEKFFRRCSRPLGHNAPGVPSGLAVSTVPLEYWL